MFDVLDNAIFTGTFNIICKEWHRTYTVHMYYVNKIKKIAESPTYSNTGLKLTSHASLKNSSFHSETSRTSFSRCVLMTTLRGILSKSQL